MQKFQLFASCILVKGHARSIIQDVQLDRYKLIPNLLYDVLLKSKENSLTGLKKAFNNELDEGIENYLDLLVKEGYGFFYDMEQEKNTFDEITLSAESSCEIGDAHIDIKAYSLEKEELLSYNLNNLKRLGCEKYALFFHDKIDELSFMRLLNIVTKADADYIEIYIAYNSWMEEEVLINILKENSMIIHFLIYNSPFEDENERAKKMVANLVFSKRKIVLNEEGDFFHPVFRNNLKFFSKSQTKNVHFHSKVYLNLNGEIRNGYNTTILHDGKKKLDLESFKALISEKYFLKYGEVNKDRVLVCCQCELRYMCIDDRVPVKLEGRDEWQYLSECKYNPLIGKFKGEEGYVSVSEL